MKTEDLLRLRVLTKIEDFEIDKNELDFLYENLYIDSQDFALQAIYLLTLADFLERLGGEIKDRVKADAIKEHSQNSTEPTLEAFGKKIQIRKTPQYIFPPNKRIDSLKQKIESLTEKVSPVLQEIDDIKQSIKTIEKQLIVDGEVIEGEPKLTIAITK